MLSQKRLVPELIALFACFGLFCTTSALAADGTFDLILASSEPARTGAACLDGSAPGFYIERGHGAGLSKWVVFFEGGGWCYDESDCLARSATVLGSSHAWKPTASFGGVLSSDSQLNPDFADWNHVHFMYCDGASFAGSRADPLLVNGTKLYLRGHKVLNALFTVLNERFSFGHATEILLTGCSAGGLATYVHADYVRAAFAPPSATFKAMPECGYFLDYPNVVGDRIYRGQMQTVFEMQQLKNSVANVNAACLHQHRATSDEWKCIFSPYTLPHVRSPYFIINSAYDQWQMFNIVGAGVAQFQTCAIGFPQNCSSADVHSANMFHDVMIHLLKSTPSFADDVQNGAFIHSCWNHCWAQSSQFWNTVRIGSRTMAQAVGDWYFERSVHNVHVDCKLRDTEPYTCNPTCH